MSFPVYDYRTDIRNLLVTPEIRSKFLRLDPGHPTGSGHTHDLGHEVFLVLEGQCRFTIDGESQVLGPGQMCVALAGQMHAVAVVGDKPMTMYLSVTPHVQPTHTTWSEPGQRRPHRFMPSSTYDVESDDSKPFDELVDEFVVATQALAQAARRGSLMERELARSVKQAMAAGDAQVAASHRGEMWDNLYPVYVLSQELASIWNDLAPRAGPTE